MFQSYAAVEEWVRMKVRHWGTTEDRPSGVPKTSSPVIIGQWELARVSLEQEVDGSIRAHLDAIIVTGPNLTKVSMSGRTYRGVLSDEVEGLLASLRKFEGTLPAILPLLLERSCRDAMAGGMSPEEVFDIARRSVVKDVMES